jgi:Putative zinc-finger
MTMNRHEAFEELISASLHGDLTDDERLRLNAHLDGCDRCRQTLAAFSDQRRMLAGLRHVAPPRDLGARVRAGVEYASVPWWRKPTTIFTAVGGTLAAVAGALLALVVLNGSPANPVGQASPTPNGPGPTASAPVSLPAQATPPPSTDATPGEPTPQPEATPTPAQLAAPPEPDMVVAFEPATSAGNEQSFKVVDGSSEDVILEPSPPEGPTATTGEPVAAELSSDGTFIAMVSREGLSGMDQVLVTHVGEGVAASSEASAEPTPTPPAAIGGTTALGASIAGSPFLERLAWSSDSRFLAYTLADPNGSGTDAWVFDTATNEFWQLTAVGDAYAASWVDVPDSEVPALWVSRAEGTVTSYLTAVMTDDGARVERVNPAADPLVVAEHVFQPLISPNGALAIYWDGVMTRLGDEWVFGEGGAPYLAEHRPFDEAAGSAFPEGRQLFSDLTIDREAFTSAAISWGTDGNAFAVWNAVWTGGDQGAQGTYPDEARVYFGHATDSGGLKEDHALDQSDLPADWSIVDVKVSPTGQDLVVMVAAPLAGDLSTPTAELWLVTRHTGDVADESRTLKSGEGIWYGPAVFDGYVEVDPGTETP